MKAYRENKLPLQLVAILLFILVFGASCSSTRFIEDDQAIVKKVKIDSIDKTYQEQAYNYVQKDIRPTGGIGFNVAIYNLFNTKNGKYKTTNIRPLGEKPPILDSALVDISRAQIEKFLKAKGFFMAKVAADVKIKRKKASIKFTAKPGPAFFVNQLNHDIKDTTIKNLYNQQKNKFTQLREGMQYDEDSLVYERDQIYQMMRQHGYYEFQRPYVRFEPDSNQGNSWVKVKLLIDNKLNGDRHQQYTFNQTNVIIAPDADGFRDTIKLDRPLVNGVRFIDQSHKFKKGPILRYNFLKKGEIYDATKEQLTYDRLYQLNVFKNIKIDYVKDSDSSNKLNSVILLTPQKRMSNRIEGEIPFNDGIIGFNISNTYTDNNFLKGAERFEVQIKGGLQSRLANGRPFQDIYQRDFSISSSLSIPRLIVPFYDPVLGKNGLPRTTFSASYLYALQKDVAVRRLFITSLTYDWVETKSKIHSLTPLNFEYRFGNVLLQDTNTSMLIDNALGLYLLDRKDITLSVKYAYTLNTDKLADFRNFVYLRGSVETAGNLLSAFSKLTKSQKDPLTGQYTTLFGLPYYQFVRPEVDIRYYRKIGSRNQFVFRLNAGVGYAYGNSDVVPFEKAFFAGGSNGMRAWQARTLGPGNYNRKFLQSEEERRLYFGIDQLGSLLMQTNFEYRFNIANSFFGGKLNGASFVDVGNVWELKETSLPGAAIKIGQLAKQVAVGTGFGLRYDVQFFVFRFDLGLKVKDPQFEGSEQWVIGKFFNGGQAFKRNYNITNAPDRYRFMQYNFGIGMPF